MTRLISGHKVNSLDPPQPKVGDFFAPFFSVEFLSAGPIEGEFQFGKGAEAARQRITSTGGIVVEQQQANGQARVTYGPNPRLAALRNFVTELRVESLAGGMNIATLVLNPPYEDAIRLIDERALQYNTFLIIQWGYLSDGSVDASLRAEKRYFTLLPPTLSASGTDVTIELRAVDMFGYSSRMRETRRTYPRDGGFADVPAFTSVDPTLEAVSDLEKGVTVFPNDLLILQELTRRNGYVIDTAALNEESLLRQRRPLNPKEPSVVEQNESDWIFFKRICAENNTDFFMMGNRVVVVDRNLMKTQDANYTLMAFGQPKEDRDIPIISFSTNALPQLFFRPEAKVIQCASIDPKTKEVTLHEYSPPTMADEVMGAGRTRSGTAEADSAAFKPEKGVTLVPVPTYVRTQTGKYVVCPDYARNRDEQIKYLARQAHILANTNMQVTIPGVPHLTPMQVVKVTGVSCTFSGFYYVQKVTHTIGTDGYQCELELFRDASTGDLVKGRGVTPRSQRRDQRIKDDGGEFVPAKQSGEAGR